MSEEFKFCTNCGNEIKENEKFCTSCGAEVKTADIPIEKIGTSKITRICIISFIVVLLVIGGCFAYQPIYQYLKGDIQVELPNYEQGNDEKAITDINITQLSNMTSKELLNEIIAQDNNFKKCLSQNKDANEQNFVTFYKNLKILTNVMYMKMPEEYGNNHVAPDFNQEKAFYVNGLQLTPHKFVVNNEYPDYYYKVTNPKTDIIKLIPESYSLNKYIELDYTYIADNYSKFLSPVFAKYLQLKRNEQVSRNNIRLWDSGLLNSNITKKMAADYLLNLRNIINANPDFPFGEYIIEDIKIYTDAFIFIGRDENTNLLSKSFEYYLKKALKDTYEYEIIEKFYNLYKKNDLEGYEHKYSEWHDSTFYDDGTPIITQYEMNKQENKLFKTVKKNNFSCPYELYKILYDNTGDNTYLEVYNAMKEKYNAEEDKQKTINEYKNLKYDKKQLHSLYKEAKKSWGIHRHDKGEDGGYLYSGSGSYVSYITDYINENSTKFENVLDSMWNYCDITGMDNEGQVEVRNCYIEEIEK